MTEIQWLVDVMLNHKLPEPVKQKFIARIGEVEATLIPRSSNGRTSSFGLENGGSNPSRGTIQAPSTQKILDEMAQHPQAVIETQAPVLPPVSRKRVVGGEVETGNGTKGPRKW